MNLITDLPEILKTRTLEEMKGDIVYVSYLQFNNQCGFFSKPSVNHRAKQFKISYIIEQGDFYYIKLENRTYGLDTKFDKECCITNDKKEAIFMYNKQVHKLLNDFDMLVDKKRSELLKMIK